MTRRSDRRRSQLRRVTGACGIRTPDAVPGRVALRPSDQGCSDDGAEGRCCATGGGSDTDADRRAPNRVCGRQCSEAVIAVGRAQRTARSTAVAAAVLAMLTVLAAIAIVLVLGATAEATGPSVHAGLAAPEQSASEATATPLTATSSPSASASASGSPAGSSSSEPSTASSAGSTTASASTTAVSQTAESTSTPSPSSTASSSATETSETTSSAPVVQTVAPATPPAAAQSPIGRGTVLIALAVLLIAIAVVALVVNATRRRPALAARLDADPAGPAGPISGARRGGRSCGRGGSPLVVADRRIVVGRPDGVHGRAGRHHGRFR